MKFGLIFMMISAVAIMAATPYLMDKMRGGSSGLSRYMPPEDVLSSSSTRQTFYKWQDAAGNWHFGDEVPDGAHAVPVNVDTAANILAPVDAPKAAVAGESGGVSSLNPELPAIPVVTPQRAEEAFRQAEQVKALMEQRTQYLESQR